MGTFHNAAIRIPLLTPLMVHANTVARRLCLDSVLAGQIFQQTGDAELALQTVQDMLEHWEAAPDTRVAKASQAIFVGVRSETSNMLFRSIFRTVNDPNLREHIGGVKWDNKTRTLQSPYGYGLSNGYKAIDVSALYYFFRGDIDRVEAAFRKAGSIGALRNKGGGMIDDVNVFAEPVPARSDMFGIVCGGQLMRPVPARCEGVLGAIVDATYRNGIVENWRAPYHDLTTKEMCLVPTQTGQHLTLDEHALAQLVQ